MKSIMMSRVGTLALALLLAFSLAFTFAFSQVMPALADHPDEEMHDDEMHDEDKHDEMHDEMDKDDDHHDMMSEEDRVAKMKVLLATLQQLIELLNKQIAMGGDMKMDDHDDHKHDDDHAHDHDEMEDSDELKVWIEIHSNMTHAHVIKPGEDMIEFFIDGYDYSEQDAIIDAIVEETGLERGDIEEVILFPTGEVDENGDSTENKVHSYEGKEMDDEYEGIHIMGDGSVMLGTGETLEDATVTDDGMIMLADGTMLEPAFDLRSDDDEEHDHDEE